MAQISASPRKYFIKSNGTPAAGGTLQIYDANTTTNAVTWFDRDGAVAHQNANPLTLDALGSCVVWMESGKVYDWIAKDSLGNTIENTLGISGAASSTIAPSPWVVTGLTPTFVNTRTFTLVGNQTAEFQPRRRIRTTNTGGTKYATIISSVFSTLTTVVLGFQNNTDVLDAGLSAVDLGLSPADNPMDMVGTGSIIDLTGYSGSDIGLGIGQTSIYDLTAASSLLLRIATATEQSYDIEFSANNVAGATLGSNANFQVNNANFGSNVCANVRNDIDGTGLVTSVGTSNNNFILTTFARAHWFKSRIFTRTAGKAVQTDYFLSTATLTYSGCHRSRCTDTTTVWTSLGTINFQEAVTGRVTVKRVL